MSSTYEIILNNNHNILFTVDSVGTISIDDLSLKDPKFLGLKGIYLWHGGNGYFR